MTPKPKLIQIRKAVGEKPQPEMAKQKLFHQHLSWLHSYFKLPNGERLEIRILILFGPSIGWIIV